MGRALRIDVVESEALVVFVDDISWNFFVDDFVEDGRDVFLRGTAKFDSGVRSSFVDRGGVSRKAASYPAAAPDVTAAFAASISDDIALQIKRGLLRQLVLT